MALVYNLKRESSDENISEDADANNRRSKINSIEAQTELQETKADTYAEWDTEETILAVKTALLHKHDVTLIEANEEAYLKFLQERPEIVFNIAEGWHGPSRESQIPAMLEMLGIPYTGSDPLTLGICLDKSRAKEILAYHGIPTPKFIVVHSLSEVSLHSFSFPSIVKPLYEGSSKGIYNSSVVYSLDELRIQIEKIIFEYHEPALIEEFLPGREFTVAMLGNNSDVQMLPIVEIRFDSLPQNVNPIYSYEAKWIWDTIENPIDVHECPARISSQLESKIEEICKKTFNILRCRDWCRIDIRLDKNGNPNILELNPLPGILPNPEEHSCFPQAARAAGINYSVMINSVLDAAIKRYGIE